jgi:hypothetical protein
MTGMARRLDWISCRTWFLRKRGCFIMSWLNIHTYDAYANVK